MSFADRPSLRYQGLGFGFDLTDALLRAYREDPYRFEKARFARATAALRLRLARHHKRRVLRQSIPALRRLLSRKLRPLPRQASALRRLRRQLFAWWDECVEARGAGDVRLVARYGERARALIVAAIRRHLPQGARGAYTPQELASLSRRRHSRQRFAPYAR